MLSLLGVMEQCLKAGKKQPWHSASVTNICVGLLAGFKVMILFSYLLVWLFETEIYKWTNKSCQALLCLRVPPVSLEILSSAQGIFQVNFFGHVIFP